MENLSGRRLGIRGRLNSLPATVLRAPRRWAGVGEGALAANRQAHAMATTAHTADVFCRRLRPCLLPAQIASRVKDSAAARKLLNVAVFEILTRMSGLTQPLARILWAGQPHARTSK